MTDGTDDKKPDPDPDYEVGYGRPPRETQFQPGRSGNPKGRKRKPSSVQDQTAKILAKKISINDGGKTKMLPLQEVILRNLANKAAKGDLKAAAFVFNLLNSPVHAGTDAIEQDSLSSEDRALLDEVMAQVMGPDRSGETDPSDPLENGRTPNDPLAEHDPDAGDDDDDR